MKIYKIPWYWHPDQDEAWLGQKASDNTTDTLAREYLMDLNLSVSNVVYSEFSEALHVLKSPYQINPHRPVIRYIDFGGVNACLWSQQDNLGRIVFFKELVLDRGGSPTQASAVQAASAQMPSASFKDFCDPAGNYASHTAGTWEDSGEPRTDVSIMQKHGIHPHAEVLSRTPSKDKVKNRTQMTKLKLGEIVDRVPVIQIDPSCQTLIDALQFGYKYATDKGGNILTVGDDLKIHEEHPYEDVIDCFAGTIIELYNVAPKKQPADVRSFFRKSQPASKFTGY